MIEYSDSCLRFLTSFGYTLCLVLNNKGCSGHSIDFKLLKVGDIIPENAVVYDYFSYLNPDLVLELNNDLQLYIDYIDEPLLQGIHINILNKNKCGCGKSFN